MDVFVSIYIRVIKETRIKPNNVKLAINACKFPQDHRYRISIMTHFVKITDKYRHFYLPLIIIDLIRDSLSDLRSK